MKVQKGAQIIDVVRFMPDKIVTNCNELGGKDPLAGNDWFRPPKERRFAHPDFTSADLGSMALKKLLNRNELKGEKLDLILYSCVFSDNLTSGIGPEIQHRVSANNSAVLSIDSGCVSFLSMLNTARVFIESGTYKTIALVTVTNFVSRLSEFQVSPRSKVLGDGASATLVAAGRPSIISFYERSHGENYGLLSCKPQKTDGRRMDFWQANSGPLAVEFSFRMVEKLRENGKNLVSDALKRVISESQASADDVDLLITHQPNMALVKQWREALGILPPKVHDTFDSYGNIFQTSIPATFSDALEKGIIKQNDLIALGAFSNGGDLVGAMTLRWPNKTLAKEESDMTEGAIQEIWHRESIETNGIKKERIPGLYLSEDHSVPEIQKVLLTETKETYSHEEVHGTYCNVNDYINCPVEDAYNYAANVFSLEEWTYSMRDLTHVGDGLYKGREALAPDTDIFVRCKAYSDSKVVDYLCAWDQGEELWMRYYFRFVDAQPTLKKPGTILMWLNCHHPYYEKGGENTPKRIADAQSRQDRPWVGDFWKYFEAGHRIEANNLKAILEHRFSKKL